MAVDDTLGARGLPFVSPSIPHSRKVSQLSLKGDSQSLECVRIQQRSSDDIPPAESLQLNTPKQRQIIPNPFITETQDVREISRKRHKFEIIGPYIFWVLSTIFFCAAAYLFAQVALGAVLLFFSPRLPDGKDAATSLLLQLLGVVGPACSLLLFTSPAIAVYSALKTKDMKRLNVPLYFAFGFSCLMGTVYGFRTNLDSVMFTTGCGLCLQFGCITSAFFLLQDLIVLDTSIGDPERSDTSLAERLPRPLSFLPSRTWKHSWAAWLLFTCFFITVVSVLVPFFYFVPLHPVLAPLYVLSCLGPYFITLSTFPGDVINHRRSLELKSTQDLPIRSPIDFNVLLAMIANNCVWLLYGYYSGDGAVIASSLITYLVAFSQLLVLILPVYAIFTPRLTDNDSAYLSSKSGTKIIFTDYRLARVPYFASIPNSTVKLDVASPMLPAQVSAIQDSSPGKLKSDDTPPGNDSMCIEMATRGQS